MSVETGTGATVKLTDPQLQERMKTHQRVRRRMQANVSRLVRHQREQATRDGSPYGHPTGREPDADNLSYDKSKCQNCGRQVSTDHRRVNGDNNRIAWGCYECYTVTAIGRGAARSPDCDGTMDDAVSIDPRGAASNLGTGGSI